MFVRNHSNDPRIPAALQHVFLESARGNENVMPPPADMPTTSSYFRLLRGAKESTPASSTTSSPRRTLLSRMTPTHHNSNHHANQEHVTNVQMMDTHQDEEQVPLTQHSASKVTHEVERCRSHGLENKLPPALSKQSSWAESSLDDTLPLEDRPRRHTKRAVSPDDGAMSPAKSKSTLDNSLHNPSGAVLSSPRRQPRHAGMSPQQYLDGMMRNRGYSVDYIKTLDTAYRSRPTPLQKASYHLHLVKLVKSCPPSALSEIISAGLSPNPCNVHGESLLHTVCRYNKASHLQVMLEHCGTDLKVCDDFGRLPLHDAW